MRFILCFLLVLFAQLSINLNAQHLERKILLSKVGTKNYVFVINGDPFTSKDSLEVDKKFKEIQISKISNIDFVHNKGLFPHIDQDLIVINYAVIMEKKNIRKKYSEIIRLYLNNNHRASMPFLYLNGNKIDSKNYKSTIKQLRKSEIGYIFIRDFKIGHEDDRDKTVQIWTKNQLQ